PRPVIIGKSVADAAGIVLRDHRLEEHVPFGQPQEWQVGGKRPTRTLGGPDRQHQPLQRGRSWIEGQACGGLQEFRSMRSRYQLAESCRLESRIEQVCYRIGDGRDVTLALCGLLDRHRLVEMRLRAPLVVSLHRRETTRSETVGKEMQEA